ncbi:MAG TPA: TPM domain-containing protein [Thermoanaerobaculia bacterium]|nr:TPM domain-containing protein [Thermoanaerobaculia bacterium]
MRNVHRPSPILLVLFLSAALAPAYAATVEQIHSPRPAGWVVDLTATLSPETQAQINHLSDAVKAQTGAEMAVVVVDSTEGVPSREFATRLFDTWHIGQRRRHNGLLVFAALGDHKAEIVLGKGLNDEVRVQESQAVMQEEMVPRFRSGDPVGAVLHGAAACAQRLLGADVALPEPVVAATPAPVETPTAAVTPAPASPEPLRPAYNPAAAYVPIPTHTPAATTVDLNQWIAGVFGGGLLLGLGVFFYKLRPVRCPRCKEKMKMIPPGDGDLSHAEQVEQQIGSVDHRIWTCPACGERAKTSQKRFFSSYETCPSCSARTLDSTETTVEEATYTHDGLIEVDERCLSCSYHDSRTYSTPMLVDRRSYSSSSSSSSSSSFFSSADRSSNSSSASGSSGGSSGSSSSGSGFGGGSSSGDGASGSW